jgi:hypothetical protein
LVSLHDVRRSTLDDMHSLDADDADDEHPLLDLFP